MGFMVTLLFYIGIFIVIMYHHNITAGTFFAVIFVNCHLTHKGQGSMHRPVSSVTTDNTGSTTPSSGHLQEEQTTSILNAVENLFYLLIF